MRDYEFKLLKVDELLTNPIRPRFQIDQKKLLKLADSIRQYGMIQPILVGKTSAGLVIIAGERRWRAAKIAGLEKVPAMVIEASSVDLILFFLEENLQREEVNLLEQAAALQRLMQRDGFTSETISNRIKITESELEDILEVTKLPEKIKDAYLKGDLSNKEMIALNQSADPLTALHNLN